MSKTKSRLMSWLLLAAMLVALLASSLPVKAFDYSSGDPYTNLLIQCYGGNYTYLTSGKVYDFTKNRYYKSGGGYLTYTQLWNTTAIQSAAGAGGSTGSVDLFVDDFTKLKAGDKQKFLENVFTIANAIANDTANGHNLGANVPTDDTVTDMMEAMQNQSGLGATMLATILQNTKPNYVSANRIYEPFSGVVGTILGVIAVLLMAALGVTMALDLAYITIPAFQMALGGTDNTGNGEKSKGIGGVISQEAKAAVKAADGGQGGQAGSGEYKAAVGIYFKYRWKGLVLLGICLLYLVQGQIYSFVAWFIDLFSGFLGF